ncbi:host attachment protein [Novosphingobium taihuense]|uniref:Protein required for attachment to host cells n=1 Tax=Novosphingobium taihuense TaxID=260085 RepID=A0A7W7ABC9_9SPHN|nr:host attachment protein [Novosphingobium taihuense]MBB4613885.1 protein required for attachment to host cells [Novosphingobium taihuense]TWH83391.1 protein required for attachment to host cells [Novosphingobium taihuense]
MLIPHAAVIAIVDGKAWELYRNVGTEAVPELATLETPSLVEQNHSSGGSHASPHQQEESAHCTAVADWLNRQVQSHKIEHLILIAPPRALGELRHQFGKATQQAMIKELAKDLIGRQPDDILAALRG